MPRKQTYHMYRLTATRAATKRAHPTLIPDVRATDVSLAAVVTTSAVKDIYFEISCRHLIIIIIIILVRLGHKATWDIRPPVNNRICLLTLAYAWLCMTVYT